MYRIELKLDIDKPFTEREINSLISENILDSVICVRDNEGNSTILKGDTKIHIYRVKEEFNYQ